MNDFIIVTVKGEPYAISKDFIAGFKDKEIYVKRPNHFLVFVEETFDEIKQKMLDYK